MKPGLGQKAAVVAAEAAGTAAADMVEAGVAVDMVTNVVVVAAVDTVTDAVAEIAEDGAAADKSLIFENLVVRTVEHLVKRS
jgi:hypothetical protein